MTDHQPHRLVLRVLVATTIVLLSANRPQVARAQGVTLPTIRVTGPTTKEKALSRSIAAARPLLDTTAVDSASRARALAVQRALDRVALTQSFTSQAALLRNARTAADSTAVKLGSLVSADSARATIEAELRRAPVASRLLDSDKLQATLDSVAITARALDKGRTLWSRTWLPVRSRSQAQEFWNQSGTSALGLGSFTGTGESGAAFTELVSPFLHAVRVSINAVLAANEGSKGGATSSDVAEGDGTPSESATSRFLAGGGLLNVGFALPLARLARPDGAFVGVITAAPRFGATLPALGASKRDSTLIYDAGLELQLQSVDEEQGIGVFFQTRLGLAGGSGRFGELLGVGQDRNHFGYGGISTGISLGGRFLISASRVVIGPESLRRVGWQVGVGVVRTGDR